MTEEESPNAPLTLYLSPGSAPCRAVWMAAKLLGVQFNVKMLDVFASEQAAFEFSKINPMNSLPTIDDDGFILWESRAILSYLVEKYGKEETKQLYPADVKQRAIINRMLYFDVVPLYYALSQFLYPQLFDAAKPDTKAEEQVLIALQYLEEIYLEHSPYAAGDHLTIADLSLLSSVTFLELVNFEMTQYPRISAWTARVKDDLPFYEECNKGVQDLKEMLQTKKIHYRNIENG